MLCFAVMRQAMLHLTKLCLDVTMLCCASLDFTKLYSAVLRSTMLCLDVTLL